MFEYFSPKYDMVKIRSLFSSIDKSAPFENPPKASQIVEMQKSLVWWRQNSGKIPDSLIWGYEEYTFHGWIKAGEIWQGAGMVDAMTLGVGGWFFAKDIAQTKESERARTRRFRIWYDSEHKYFCHQVIYDSSWDKSDPDFINQLQSSFSFYGRR